MMCVSLIVFGSFLSWGAFAKERPKHLEWTAANIDDNVTLSWSLPQSLKTTDFFFVKLKTSTSLVTQSIFSMKKYTTYVEVKTIGNTTERIEYTGNISITWEGIFSFIVKKVKKEDAGKYICDDGENQERNCGQTLVVLQRPSTPNISVNNYKAVTGQPVTLTCSSISKSLPPDHPLTLSYTWKRYGRNIQQTNGSELTLQNVTRNDTGTYTCQAIDGIEDKEIRSNWSRQLKLYGPDQVKFDPDRDTVTASEGQNISVTCSADCNPPCNVKWLDNRGQTVPQSSRKTVIHLTERESDKSPYKCVVKNSFGSTSRNASIQIPSSIRNCTSNTGREDGTVDIECSVYGEPKPNVSFILRGESYTLELNSTLPDNTFIYSYVLNHARCSDHGKYDVTAFNNVESPDNYQLYLKVKCAPRMQEHHGSIHLQKNKSHVFWAFDILAYPKPTSEKLYYLPDNGRRREVDNKLHCQQQAADNLLTCIAVYPGDETPHPGKYVISFQHVEGDTDISLNVADDEVRTGPPPSNAIIPAAAVCSVLVLVLAVVAAVFIQRYKSKKGSERYRVREDVEEYPKSCGPSGDGLYATVKKTKRKKNKDVYATVKKHRNTPQACTNKLYASAGPKVSLTTSLERTNLLKESKALQSESQALINPGSADELDGTLNNNRGEKNAEGLTYADLDLPAPTMVNGQPVINSKEESVVYEEIDFSQTPGPQLPEKIWEKVDSAP